MSGGEIAGLIVAVFFAILVCFLAFVLVRLAGVLREATKLVAGVSDKTVPLLGEVTNTVVSTNAQLARVDAITENVQTISTNATALSSAVSATLGGPLVKAAAFSYGVRKAVGERRKGDIEKRVRAEIKAERKAKRDRS